MDTMTLAVLTDYRLTALVITLYLFDTGIKASKEQKSIKAVASFLAGIAMILSSAVMVYSQLTSGEFN